eukprot:TRINITY_DN60710_c0_g1_i1.p1 TRINITY_DN60710_c0_g1~~TRINITY_DN60710_c0_g1_i1.p1  ORF type:complete len:420 (-),score=52.30 TRINITY_DN60710_c0_g1_i1:266-1525(-)
MTPSPSPFTDPLLIDAKEPISCPVTRRVGGTCPMEEFQLPENGFKGHPGGQFHLETAKDSDCAGLLFLVYHLGLDLDSKISATAKALGVQIPEYGTLFADLHALVRTIKKENQVQHKVFVCWCLIITLGLLVAFPWFLVAPSALAAVVNSFVFEIYFLNIFHTRHHKGGNLYGIPWLDSLTAQIYDLVDKTWGYYPQAWWQNHHLKHHMHTNENECDPDMPAMYPMIRMFESQERYWFHMAQSFYWPFLLLFSVARFPIQNLLVHGGRVAYFLLWVVLMWVIPCLHGTAGLGAALVVQGLTGLTLTYKFAVSHSSADLIPHGEKEPASLLTRSDMTIDHWLANQIEESTSWGGYWTTLIFGGINLQIEHHVAPAIDPPLLWFMAQGVKKICKTHGIQYTEEPSLLHAMYKFHKRLWIMS